MWFSKKFLPMASGAHHSTAMAGFSSSIQILSCIVRPKSPTLAWYWNHRGQSVDCIAHLEMMIKEDIPSSKIPMDQIVALQVRHPFQDFFTPNYEAV